MKVALIQMNSGSDKAANIAAARALMERAIAERETPLDRRNGEPAPKKREPFRALQKPVWDDEL